MRRSLLSFSLVVLGFIASAVLDGLPRQLTLLRIHQMDMLYLRWVNVALDILFAVIVLFILWWTTIKIKPDKALSILFVLIGLAMLILGSIAFYVMPSEILDSIHLTGLLFQFHFLVCSPNNIYFLSYSGMMAWIGLKGLVKLKPYAVEKPLSFLTVAAGVILSYGVDQVHQIAYRKFSLMNTNFFIMFPVENLLFAGILIFVVWWLLILNKPSKLTLVISLILGIGLLLYKSSLLFNFPHLMPSWYARQQMLSVCSPFSFAVTYGGLIVVVALIGLFRKGLPSNSSETSLD